MNARPLTDLEWNSLQRNLKPYHARAAAFMLNTGARLQEALRLHSCDFDPDLRAVYIRSLKKRGRERIRVIPLNRTARAAIQEAIRSRLVPGGPIFRGRSGRPISARALQRALARAGARAGIVGRVSPHVLRHSFADRLRRSGSDRSVIRELLGHERESTIEAYLHPDRRELESAVARLSAR